MSTIAELNVAVTANTSGFKRGMEEAHHGITSLTVAVGIGIEKLAEFGVELAAHAVESMKALVEKSMEAIETSVKLSERLGMNVTDLMALEAAAKLTGSSAASLDNAMSKFIKTLGGAEESANGGNAAKAFEMLGLSMKDVMKNDKAEGLAVIAMKMKDITNATQRAYIETSLFGKGGQELDGLLRELSENGLDEVVESAKKTGETLDDVSAYQVTGAAEAIKKLQGFVVGLGNALAVQLAPFIQFAAEKLVDFANSAGGMSALVSKAFNAVVDWIGYMYNALSAAKAAWYGFQAVVNTVVDFIIVTPLRNMASAMDFIVVGFQKGINTMIEGWNKFQNKVAEAQRDYAHFQKELARSKGDSANVTYYNNLERLAQGDMDKNSIKPLEIKTTGIAEFFDSIHNELQKNAAEGVDGFTKNFDDWVKGRGHDDFVMMINGIKDKSIAAATDAAKAAHDRMGGDLKDVHHKPEKEGSFREVNTALINVAGLARQRAEKHDVNAPQLDITNKTLLEMKALMAQPAAAVVS